MRSRGGLGSSRRDFVGLEVNSWGGFVSQKSAVREVCESRSEQSGGFGSLEAGVGDLVSLAVRNRESLSRSKRGVGREQEASRGVR